MLSICNRKTAIPGKMQRTGREDVIKRKRRFRPVLVLPTGGIIKESHDQRVILVVSLASLVILIVMVIKDFLFFVSIEFKHHRHEPPFFFSPHFF